MYTVEGLGLLSGFQGAPGSGAKVAERGIRFQVLTPKGPTDPIIRYLGLG